jgi:hypothetical protein
MGLSRMLEAIQIMTNNQAKLLEHSTKKGSPSQTAESEPIQAQEPRRLAACSIACPQCGQAIVWHRDGTVWHGHCVNCARTLREALAPDGCLELEMTYIPDTDVLLNIRGC